MQTYVEEKLIDEMTAPGLMIHRHRLDQHLADLAVKAGALLKTGFQAYTVNDGQVMAGDKGRVKISCQIIIGADGPSSQVSRWMINPAQVLFDSRPVPSSSDPFFRPDPDLF